jgi:ABC-type multidrug transport system fused ATPase/permease subunit
VRVLDPRLLRAARPARALLGAGVAAAFGIALLVVAQAWLLASVVAAAANGSKLEELAGELALLVSAFAARGALTWAVEVAGRRAASTVLSELRPALAARRLEAQPAALDGVQAGEIAAVGVQGVDALGTYFARCLPQVVLAAVVPATVLVAVAILDPLSAVLMLATLPLVRAGGRWTRCWARSRCSASTSACSCWEGSRRCSCSAAWRADDAAHDWSSTSKS